MFWLKQSTSVVVQFGPFVDVSDGATLEVGLATAMDHATTGIRISKNGGVLIDRNDATVPAYDAMGCYRITFSTTDTNALGSLKMIFEEAATCLPVWENFMVVPANVWDSFFGADKLQIDAIQWLGTACATPSVNGVPEVDLTHVAGSTTNVSTLATKVNSIPTTAMVGTDNAALATALTTAQNDLNTITGTAGVLLATDQAGIWSGLQSSVARIVKGTASATPTTTTMESNVSADSNTMIGRVIIFDGNVTGGLKGTPTAITGFNTTNGVFTFTELLLAPVSSDTFVVV